MFTEIEDFDEFEPDPIPKRKHDGRIFRVHVMTGDKLCHMSVICMQPKTNEQFAAEMVATFGRERIVRISNT